SEPIRLRRWSRIALACLVALVLAGELLSGARASLLTALAWVCGPFVAFGIGYGEAFFIQHGQRRRTLLLTIFVSICVTLTACVILAILTGPSPSRDREVASAALHGLLYAGVVLGLAALIGWGIGRGEEYVSRRIDKLSDEEW
ncbi:MAG: hypothetical protein ACRD1H_06140, partial [Vicinamibacterales bacterium]